MLIETLVIFTTTVTQELILWSAETEERLLSPPITATYRPLNTDGDVLRQVPPPGQDDAETGR